MLYYRIVEDPRIVQANPGGYEKVLTQSPRGQQELYVEKTPALRIGQDEVRLLVVERGPLICSATEADLYLATRKARPGPQEQDRTLWVTYFVSPKAAAKLRDFGNQNTGRLVDLRIDGRRLVTTRLVGKFGGGREYTVATDDADTARLRTVLEPFRDIAIWK